jgi:hypothetical protein
VLSSQLCAELEGRAGQVSLSLLATYGDFLGDESAFRTHEKLPNVIERLVANEAWEAVEWFVNVATKHHDAVSEAGRQAELQHLRSRVAEKATALGAGSPTPLLDLADLLGVALQHDGEAEAEADSDEDSAQQEEA